MKITRTELKSLIKEAIENDENDNYSSGPLADYIGNLNHDGTVKVYGSHHYTKYNNKNIAELFDDYNIKRVTLGWNFSTGSNVLFLGVQTNEKEFSYDWMDSSNKVITEFITLAKVITTAEFLDSALPKLIKNKESISIFI